MIPRSKGTIVLITVALLVLALTTMLPTAASASPLIASDPPWRGNGLASGFVYGHSYNTDSQVYQWQQVHTYLYERIAWWWYKCSSASNVIVRQETGSDMTIVGIEKSGNFVSHFEEIDQREDGGQYFQPSSYFLPTDAYIKERIIFSHSPKPYGEDTYSGRKFFYKTKSGARIVASIPFLTPEQDSIESDDPTPYPRLGTVCALLDKLVTSRFPNALAPIVSAHAQASIPLHLGQKVLRQLAQALMRQKEE